MKFKWDWEEQELVLGEDPKNRIDVPVIVELCILPACAVVMYVFIQYIAPWLGKLLLGGFL